MHVIQCRCGKFQGHVLPGRLHNRLRCYCVDCQAFARHFPPEVAVLDPDGGSEIVQVSQARVVLTQGADQLAAIRLSETGLLRWYARCCHTPLCNTADHPGSSLVGLIHTCLSPVRLDQDFGPYVARVNTQGARTPAPLAGNGLPGVLARYVGIVLGDRLARRSGRSPFFTADGQPVVPPRVLSADERAALYAAPRATAG